MIGLVSMVAVVSALVASSAVLAGSSAVRKGLNSVTVTAEFSLSHLSNPSRTVVRTGSGAWLATFTNGARTAVVVGPSRTFSEASTPDRVVSTTWVRLLPAAFSGQVDDAWLSAALLDRRPDVLATAMQYLDGAPTILGPDGGRIAGDADYGPLQADGTRAEGSDFNDYLGRTWTYPDGSIDRPETDQLGSLDCSGFVRMVFGFRRDLPVTLKPDGSGLPRRAVEQIAVAPGVTVLPNTGSVPAGRSPLQPGDLVFFDASTNDGALIDHVGIYLGRDSAGHDRFISSRKGANGPTLGDIRGRSILDGTGLYALSFRAARRL